MTHATPEEKLLDLIKKAQGQMRLKKELRFFSKINIILIGIIIVILAIFLLDVFRFNKYLPELEVNIPDEKIEFQPQTYDLEAMDLEVVSEQEIVPKKDLVKNLSLLGIVTGNNNQAIIEDKESGRTFFLYKGDKFKDFTIYDIREESVTLEYNEEHIELKM